MLSVKNLPACARFKRQLVEMVQTFAAAERMDHTEIRALLLSVADKVCGEMDAAAWELLRRRESET